MRALVLALSTLFGAPVWAAQFVCQTDPGTDAVISVIMTRDQLEVSYLDTSFKIEKVKLAEVQHEGLYYYGAQALSVQASSEGEKIKTIVDLNLLYNPDNNLAKFSLVVDNKEVFLNEMLDCKAP